MLDARTVQIERVLPGPIERVWDYLTKGIFLTRWDPPRALAYTWVVDVPNSPADAVPGEDSVITFELEPQGKKVQLTRTLPEYERRFRMAVGSSPGSPKR
jgi:uncharacterized protein YndB with AHSA1/START domain